MHACRSTLEDPTLRLRANNASTRLTGLAIAAGCVASKRAAWFERRNAERSVVDAALGQQVSAADLITAGMAVRPDGSRRSLSEWLRFPEVTLDGLEQWLGRACPEDALLCEEIEEGAAYAPYLSRQDAELRDLRASDALPLGDTFPFGEVPGLSREMVERLERARPDSLASAGRVPGITPAALASLLVHARRRAA